MEIKNLKYSLVKFSISNDFLINEIKEKLVKEINLMMPEISKKNSEYLLKQLIKDKPFIRLNEEYDIDKWSSFCKCNINKYYKNYGKIYLKNDIIIALKNKIDEILRNEVK